MHMKAHIQLKFEISEREDNQDELLFRFGFIIINILNAYHHLLFIFAGDNCEKR